MAKKRPPITRRSLKNAHMIGKGGKQIKPINGKWVDGYKKAYGKPKAKSTPIKTAFKSTTSLTPPTSSAFAKTVKSVKAQPPKQISSKMRQAMYKPKSSKSVTKTIKRKPPTKGR